MTHAGGFAPWLRIAAAFLPVLFSPFPVAHADETAAPQKTAMEQAATVAEKADAEKKETAEKLNAGITAQGEELKRVEVTLGTTSEPAESYRTIAGGDYLLGAYDQLAVSVLGPKPEKWEVTVTPEGSVTLPLVGTVKCSGLRVDAFEKKLTRAFSRYLRNFNLSVNVTHLRGIEVTLTGQVISPGSYSLDGQTRLWQAIQHGGGITNAGSVRAVHVRGRDGKEKVYDLYPFLFEGNKEANPVLDTSDTIYVPVAERLVGLRGEVRRSGIYEFKTGENLSRLLALAGNTTANAALDKAYLTRSLPGEQKAILHMPLTPESNAAGQAVLNDGDLLVIPGREIFLGSITVQGEVRAPGTYPRKENMRLSDVLLLAGGCKANAALSRVYVQRIQVNEKPQILFVNAADALNGNPNANLPLQDGDLVQVPSADALSGVVTINGEVHSPLTQPLAEGMRVSDLVKVAGGLTANAAPARAYLERVTAAGEKKQLLFLDLNAALAEDAASNITLQDGDSLTVPAAKIYYGKVGVTGELRSVAAAPVAAIFNTKSGDDDQTKAAGADERARLSRERQYDLVAGMRVSDLVRLAGGPTATAAMDQARIIRIKPDGMKEAIPVDLRDIIRQPGGKPDLPLQDGDILQVPSISVLQETVVVAGELVGTGVFQSSQSANGDTVVKRRGIYELKKGDTIRDLVLAMGGVTANAALRAARLERRGPDNRLERKPVDLYRLLIQKEESANVVLQNGDEFIVPAIADMVYVVGAVSNPGAYEYREGTNRVMDMIARAGGKTPRAILSQVRLIRSDAGPDQRPQRVNMEAVMNQGKLAEDPSVHAGDIIFVPEKTVTMQDVMQVLANVSLLRLYAGL